MAELVRRLIVIALLIVSGLVAATLAGGSGTRVEAADVAPGDLRVLDLAGSSQAAVDPLDLRAEVLEVVNDRREAVRVTPLAAAPALDTAAQAHADYLAVNGEEWGTGTFNAHTEFPEYQGFYAARAGDRALKAGYPHDRVYEDVMRLQTIGGTSADSPWSAEELVESWIDAPLHRRAVLDRSLVDLGWGYDAVGPFHAYVLNTALDHLASSKPSSVQPYPADGQTGVPVDWDGNESPQPFPGLAFPCGYPITVFPIWGGSEFYDDDVRLELRRTADGAEVEVVRSPVLNVAFAPVEPLEPGTGYTAEVEYTLRHSYTGELQSGWLTWEFTTAGSPPSTTTTLPGSTTTTLPATTSTSVPATTTTTLPPAFADVPAGHRYAVAIASMAARGVIAGYVVAPGGTRVFRPDDLVKRAQFAKMIVGALELPVEEGAVVCPFADVQKPSDDLYPDDYVAVAAAAGITRGFADGTFGPYRTIARAQVISMVVRAAEAELPGRLTPPDAGFGGILPTSDPSHGANIRTAEANGLLDGIPLQGWSVWGEATRGEVAQILYNLVGP